MVVLDGIVMGPTHCAYDGCTSDLMNARGGAFCPFHETELGNQCHVHNYQRSKVNPTQACDQHQLEWKKYVENHSQENLSGVRRILRSRENMPWKPNTISIPFIGQTPMSNSNTMSQYYTQAPLSRK